MLKLIIVDDERATREKLVENMRWDKLQIEVAGEARDGIEGLELARRVSPDIILLDVRMPRMNGMECAAQIRKENETCQIVFLSGFTDKDYLKSAIHLKAVDYIEKPIDLDELHAVLKKTAALCRERQLESARQSELAHRAEQNAVRLKHELALAMSVKHADTAAIKKQLEGIGLPVSLNDNYRSILLQFNLHRMAATDSRPALRNETMLARVCRHFESAAIPCLAGMADASHAVIHVYGHAADRPAALSECVKRLQADFDAECRIEGVVTAGIGKSARGMEHVHLSCRTAREALQHRFLTGHGSIILYKEEAEADISFDADGFNRQLRDWLREGDDKAALARLERIADEMTQEPERVRVPSAQAFFLSVLLRLSALAGEFGLTVGEKWKHQELQWAERLNESTAREASVFLREQLAALFAQAGEQQGKSKKIRAAMAHIKDHYGDDLSVSSIADRLELRSTYLSTLFKKETGKTIGEFIEAVRMEKARELLRDDRLKINEVARAVGYHNPNYFTAVFKKATGSYPSDYKRSSLS